MARFLLKNKDLSKLPVVTNHESIDKKGDFTEDGIFSEKIFGPDSDVDNITNEAIIDLGNNFIITPLGYDRVKKLIGRKRFAEIISSEKPIDENGNVIEPEDDHNSYIGLVEFRQKFLKIIKEEVKRDKRKSKDYNRVVQWYLNGTLFQNYVTVFSPKLRPATVNKATKTFRHSEINKEFNLLIAHSNSLKDLDEHYTDDSVELQKLNLLNKIQDDSMNIYERIVNENIKGKMGTIRKLIMGSRVGYSARSVIVPAPDLRLNEIRMNYTIFLEIYKPLLANMMYVTENIPLPKAEEILSKALDNFNPKVYKYMNELVNKTEGGMRVILNRNPSISESSVQILKIKDIIKDIDSAVVGISNNILAGMGADYDGDTLNIIALFSQEQYNMLKVQDPVNQLISYNDGLFNRTYSLNKDSQIAVYLLNNPKSKEVGIKVKK
ncbi:DNA-directed RNA polymerase beta' subunit [Staphylococcus phage vB_StaM_SA1]|nr:DNA-directed RNA polymerase beta' subunit [Staphylococcus phage vB_StaM_SA1]